MSKYTTEVRFICEAYAGHDMSSGYGEVNSIIQRAYPQIFDFDFPMFDPEYRSVLCQKILRHYYTREIGFETVGLWKLKLETKLNEIMPYYNKLYETETFRYNPLYDVDYTKEHEGEDNGSEDIDVGHTGTVQDAGSHGGTVGDSGTHGGTIGDSSSHTGTVGDSGTHTGTIGDVGTHTGTVSDEYSKEGDDDTIEHRTNSETDWDVFSDTPQGALTNVDNNTYLTNARKITKSEEEDKSSERDYSEDGSSTKTYNEGTGNTRTFNEGDSNTRTFNEQNSNTKTFNETQGNTRTYNETTGNTRTYNENNSTGREFNTTREYSEHVVGKVGGKSYASMVVEYRESLLNIDMMIITDLSDLFMKVW